MKRFALKLFALLLLLFGLPFIILLLVCPQYTHDYNASFVDKMKRLERIKEPKIVLVSNSNLAFGIQSDLIESAFGLPVVNLGLHGGLGNAFLERMPLFNITEGDIIVIAHSDYSDDDTIPDPELALLTVENHFHYWKIFRAKDFPRIIAALPRYAYKCLFRCMLGLDKEPSSPTCYARSAFNSYGDNVFPRNIESGKSELHLHHPGVNRTCADRVNKLHELCGARGATVVIVGAPIVCGLPGFDQQEYIEFQKDVEELAECPVISDFTEYIFDKRYFYDTPLHLTNEGARLRTEQLIRDLQGYQDGIVSP